MTELTKKLAMCLEASSVLYEGDRGVALYEYLLRYFKSIPISDQGF